MQLIDYDQLGNEIDRFLLTRPWWYVSKEPYAWHEHTHSSNVIIIDRVKHGFEKELRLLGSRQYRTAENCEKAPLTIGTLDAVHPGWLTVLVFYTTAQGNIPFSVFGIYVPHKNAFISQNDCPDNHNKWECGFLKTTNCSLPKIITDCTTHDCIRSIPEVSDTTVLFTSSSINATYVRPNTEEHKGLKAMAHYPIPINENLNVLLKELDVYVTPVMKYRKPYLDSVPWTGFLRAGVFPFMKFIFRQTYLYRSHIARLLDRFYSKTGIRNTDRCVAAHVRRGDRATSFGEQITNMTEYCYKHRHNRGGIVDLGCFSTPFASVTLGHVLDSAAKLVPPEVRTLILASDDEPWMVSEIEAMRQARPEWKVYFLEAPKPENHDKKSSEEKYYYMRSSGGTVSGTFWWGSIELARQCEGFVGHFGSGATMFFHKQLCELHQDFENTCPASFDIRTIPELQTHMDE